MKSNHVAAALIESKPTFLASVGERLQSILERADGIHSRMQGISERVYGPQPVSTEGNKLVGVPGGLYNGIESQLDRLESLLTVMHDEVSNLERIA